MDSRERIPTGLSHREPDQSIQPENPPENSMGMWRVLKKQGIYRPAAPLSSASPGAAS